MPIHLFDHGARMARPVVARLVTPGLFCAAAAVVLVAVATAQQVASDAPMLTEAAARALKNPIGSTSQSIGRGKLLYVSLGCADCHGRDGKALIEVVANATDLTNPDVWKNGADEGLIFRSIRDGAGLAMPPFKTQVGEPDDIWHLVNFIRSLWPEGRRPSVTAGPGE